MPLHRFYTASIQNLVNLLNTEFTICIHDYVQSPMRSIYFYF